MHLQKLKNDISERLLFPPCRFERRHGGSILERHDFFRSYFLIHWAPSAVNDIDQPVTLSMILRGRGGTGLIWKVYWFTFATRNFHNGATAVFSPLPFTTRDGLDPTIAPRSQSPKQIHVPAVAQVIKARGHNQ